jgi:hypothetical protein
MPFLSGEKRGRTCFSVLRFDLESITILTKAAGKREGVSKMLTEQFAVDPGQVDQILERLCRSQRVRSTRWVFGRLK